MTVPLGRYAPNTKVELNGFGTLNATSPNTPFGISFMGPKWSEELLIGLAYAFEQRTKVRNTITPYVEPGYELVDAVTKRMRGGGKGDEGLIMGCVVSKRMEDNGLKVLSNITRADIENR